MQLTRVVDVWGETHIVSKEDLDGRAKFALILRKPNGDELEHDTEKRLAPMLHRGNIAREIGPIDPTMMQLRAAAPMRPKREQHGHADLPLFQTDLEEFTR
jgi:hypothetical protein